MLDKIMVLAGVILSFLLFYFCIGSKGDETVSKNLNNSSVVAHTTKEKLVEDKNNKSNELKSEIQQDKKPIKEESREKEIGNSDELKNVYAKKENKIPPSFKYVQKEEGGFVIEAFIKEKDKDGVLFKYIEERYKSPDFIKEIHSEKNREDAKWQDFVLSIIKFFEEKGASKRFLSVQDDTIVVEGVFKNREDIEQFKKLLSKFENTEFKLDDRTYVMVEDLAEKEDKKIKETESKIAKMLQMEPVRFKLNSAEITPESKITLQKAIELLDSLNDDVFVEVAGYTDARGDEKYNLALSQRRADSVKKYLQEHMKTKKKMTAKGYGESNFIAEDPNDKKNRRVEIHLMREGE